MPCSLVSTVAMDVGEAAMTQHLESVSVNRDTSLIVTAKLASVVKKTPSRDALNMKFITLFYLILK